ncbi:MAG TPA: excalibur calcium-binding domain-containing protein [Thermoleophilaceae bacterium]|nr:excalibur calcium-binding domain-containing protein [Thermoleophilaceae bacterium]
MLVLASAAFAATADQPTTDRAATAIDDAASDESTSAAEGKETAAENKQSVRGNGRAQEAEVSTAQVDGDDDADARVRKAAADRDCGDFTSQDEAQQFFDEHNGSATNNVDNLDADGDGRACEDPDSGSSPVGGIDTGGGGTATPPGAGSSAGPLPFVLGGAAVGLLMALLGPSLRRRLTA